MNARYRVADILQLERSQLTSLSFTSWHLRTLQAIRRCRTSEMGGHIDKCDCCDQLHISYNSCRNRHCPSCQGHKREEWIQSRKHELLDVPYFYVVFTIPDLLNPYCLQHPKEMYAAMFKAAWSTLRLFGKKELSVKPGMIAILHTWGQNLSLHPHLHCIVPAIEMSAYVEEE